MTTSPHEIAAKGNIPNARMIAGRRWMPLIEDSQQNIVWQGKNNTFTKARSAKKFAAKKLAEARDYCFVPMVLLAGEPTLERATERGFAKWLEIGHDRPAEPEPMETYSQERLDRCAVNQLRHGSLRLVSPEGKHHDYRTAMDRWAGSSYERYRDVKLECLAVIADKFPSLQGECDRQAARIDEDWRGYQQRRAGHESRVAASQRAHDLGEMCDWADCRHCEEYGITR